MILEGLFILGALVLGVVIGASISIRKTSKTRVFMPTDRWDMSDLQ